MNLPAADAGLLPEALLAKEARLKALLASCETLAVAYSGGVDSSYLADVAHEVLGGGATMILADSPSVPRSELREAIELARARGWNLRVIQTSEFTNDAYLANNGARCYHCRSELFAKMHQYAKETGLRVIAYGAIMDDMLDPTRLGARAAKERSVLAPLQEAGLSKEEIRQLSHRRDLPTASKAAFACLSSRFPTGTRVTLEDIAKVEAAEEALKRAGFHQYRARHHGDTCRIEIDPSDMARILEPAIRDMLLRAITAAGYRYVTLDLAGYRTGSSALPPAGH